MVLNRGVFLQFYVDRTNWLNSTKIRITPNQLLVGPERSLATLLSVYNFHSALTWMCK